MGIRKQSNKHGVANTLPKPGHFVNLVWRKGEGLCYIVSICFVVELNYEKNPLYTFFGSIGM